MNEADLTLWLVFGAGILSFLSPCCLPLYPSFLSYLTGVSVKDLQNGRGLFQKHALWHTVFFMIGFSLIFFALGLSASIVGELFSAYQELIRKLGGIMVTVMGLVLLGIFTPSFLMKTKRLQLKSRSVGYSGSILVGITYAAGWTPCIGPILAAVLALGITRPDQAFVYTTVYTLGFAIPFLLMAFFIGKMKWVVTYSRQIMRIGGSLMILTGIMLYTDQMTKITVFLIRLFGGFTGF